MPKATTNNIKLRKTRVKNIMLGGHMQKGLFADEPISKGDVVIRMSPSKSKILARRTYKRRLATTPDLKHDFAIEVQGDKYATDWHTSAVPKWYRMNHSALAPNVEYEWVGKMRTGYVAWRATKAIRKGAEIKFDYGDAPVEWG